MWKRELSLFKEKVINYQIIMISSLYWLINNFSYFTNQVRSMILTIYHNLDSTEVIGYKNCMITLGFGKISILAQKVITYLPLMYPIFRQLGWSLPLEWVVQQDLVYSKLTLNTQVSDLFLWTLRCLQDVIWVNRLVFELVSSTTCRLRLK